MNPIVLDFLAHHARVMPDKIALRELATGRSWTWRK